MNILVTGALGHIGSHFIRSLQLHGAKTPRIVIVDNFFTQRFCSLFNLPDHLDYTFIEGDVKTMDWSSILAQSTKHEPIDVVIHLAALTDAAGTADKPEMVHDNNFESTKTLAQVCRNNNVPLIFPSSTSVYGSQSTLVDETCTELAPQSPYAACKIREEQYIQSLCAEGLKATIVRLGTIYGTSPGMRFHTAVNKFCFQAVMGQSVTVWETALHQKRPYLALNDCTHALQWIIKNKLYDGEIYNIVSNNATVQEVIDAIKEHCANIDIKLVQHKIMNQLSYEVATHKFCATGFSFKGNLANGITETIHLLKNAYTH